MNDFTKEELQYLLWSIKYTRERTNNCGDAMRGLMTKIQFLIDNYCKHDRKNHADVNWASIHSQSCGNNL